MTDTQLLPELGEEAIAHAPAAKSGAFGLLLQAALGSLPRQLQ